MYDESALNEIDVESSSWALAQLRFILRDTVSPYVFADAELTNTLAMHTFEADSTTYYRPHVAAATLVRSDPERAITESIDNAGETRPDPAAVAGRILRSYSRLDDLIEDAAGSRPSAGTTRAEVTF